MISRDVKGKMLMGALILLSGILPHLSNASSSSRVADWELLEHSYRGNFQMVMALLEQGANPNFVGPRGYRPLHYAARQGHTEIVRALVAARADCNVFTHDGETPLIFAAKEGNDAALKELLTFRGCADPNLRHRYTGESALLLTASQGDVFTAAFLLTSGADPNLVEREGGDTPLLRAAKQRHGGLAILLLNAGAFVDTKNSRQESALSIAVKNGDHSLFEILLPWLPHIEIPIYQEWSVLTYSAVLARAGMVREAIRRGADPNRRDREGRTALTAAVAATGASLETVHALLEAGGLVDERDHAGNSALIYSLLSAQRRGVARELILRSTALDTPGGWTRARGYAPLALAIDLPNFELVSLLIERGANPRGLIPDGRSFLQLAQDRHQWTREPAQRQELKRIVNLLKKALSRR